MSDVLENTGSKSIEALMAAAGAQLAAGDAAGAVAHFRQVLARNPNHARASWLLAMMLTDLGQVDESEGLLRRRLSIPLAGPIRPNEIAPALAACEAAPDRAAQRVELACILFELGKVRQIRGDDAASVLLFETATILKPDYAAAFNNVALSLHRLGRRDLALDVVEKALAIDPAFGVALRNRGHIQMEMRRPEAAAESFEAWTRLTPVEIQPWIDLAIAALAIPDLARARAALDRALAIDPAHVEAHLQMASLFDLEHRPEEAARHRIEAARRHGVVQLPCLGPRAEGRVLVVGGAGMCNASYQFVLDRRRFETVVAYLQPPGVEDSVAGAPTSAFPDCDVVINAIADADQGADFMAKAREFCGQFGKPVINPPDHRIARTDRDGSAELLRDVPGLIVPRMRRLDRAALAEIAAAPGPFATPMLVRPIGAHGGDDLVRAETGAELAAFLASIPVEHFYVSDFHDYRSADGFWRKYRLVFVDREVFPYHLVIGKHWKLHYYRVDMAEQDWMKPEEEAFLTDWTGVFAGPRADAVREVARRMDLDYAGIDCAIAPDGRVLLFEANPTMLVHLTDSRLDYPYKHKYVPRIFAAFSDMILRRRAAAEATRAA